MRFADAVHLIKERINIVDLISRYVELKRNGSRFVAPCPFHQESKPSFSVSPEKGFFHCFGCNASGDIFEFYSRINGLEFRDALEQLAKEAGVVIDRNSSADRKENKQKESARRQMLKMHELACRHFIACMAHVSASDCRAYIAGRGISQEMLASFQIGWAPRSWHSLKNRLREQNFSQELALEAGLLSKSNSGNYFDRFRGRLIFPIKDISGQIIAFGGRIIGDEDEAKYINSAESPIYKKKENLFGLAQARRAICAKGEAILTEGYMDVLTLHQFGFENGVGVLGTALTEEQIRRLSGFTSKIFLVFDGDAAGRKAALRSAELLLCRGLLCSVALLPEGEDIDSLLRSEGPDALNAALKKAIDGLEFCIDTIGRRSPREAINWARDFLSKVTLRELVPALASKLALNLGIGEAELRDDISSRARENYKGRPEPTRREELEAQILIYAVRYPPRLQSLRDLGADLKLNSSWAKNFWSLLSEHGEEAIYYLDEEQKSFWQKHRHSLDCAPLDNGDFEFECLKDILDNFYKSAQKSTLSAVLAENQGSGNFDADLECLRALQETIREGNEQSK